MGEIWSQLFDIYRALPPGHPIRDQFAMLAADLFQRSHPARDRDSLSAAVASLQLNPNERSVPSSRQEPVDLNPSRPVSSASILDINRSVASSAASNYSVLSARSAGSDISVNSSVDKLESANSKPSIVVQESAAKVRLSNERLSQQLDIHDK